MTIVIAGYDDAWPRRFARPGAEHGDDRRRYVEEKAGIVWAVIRWVDDWGRTCHTTYGFVR
ncbi:hypothetical protein [Nonomuraea sp. NPDC050643]|uniref:hypothetical protein n=1 Tax=Nonomuraea sp. NPDC050643 TaxID=3155660 RepID=UPI0034090E7B